VSGKRTWLAERAAIWPARPALEIAGRAVSYAELAARARELARRLRALGVREGDVVAALLPNGLAFAELLHAVPLCNATLLPLNLRLTARELAVQLRDGGARLLLHGGGALAERAAATAAAEDGRNLQTVEVGLGAERAPAPPAAEPDPDPGERIDPRAPLAILFTSGTTGRPKGAMLSHQNFLWSAVGSAFHLGVAPTDRWLACLPFYHVGGLSILLRCALYGIPAVVHERFDPEAVNRALDEIRVTLVSLVPTMLERVLAARGPHRAPPGLRCILLGGGPAPAPLLQRAAELGFPVAPTYGLTEAASQVATRPPHEAGLPRDTDLRPLFGTEVRILDAQGRRAPPGEAGEIVVRGPTVMLGYANRPRETADALRDGWLHTGDAGVLDTCGALRVLDRRGDLIDSGGENVYPAEIEAVLLEHPAVAEAAVAAVPDPEYGRRPAAWLVLRVATTPGDPELRAFCRSRLAGYKVPVAFHRVAALPRDASGKLARGRLA
jgi:O-succinylbenzoic acid--CoA ligase